MKQENYYITSSIGYSATKYKWNSALKEIVAVVREIAIRENTVYELVDSEAHKEGFGHVSGHQTWKGKNGNVVTFSVRKEGY